MAGLTLPAGSGSLVLQSLAFMREPTRLFEQLRTKHGQPFTVNLPVGKTVVTGAPEALKELFGADPELFEVLGQLPLVPVVGETSVLVTAGAGHRRKRKLLMPPFHGERMRAYGELIQSLALRSMDGHPVGAPLRAQELTTDLSLQVIIRAVFGVTEPARAERYRTVLNAFIDSYTPPLAGVPALRRNFGGWGPWARFQRQVAALEVLLDEELALRRAQGTEREDILSLLLAARDEDGLPMPDAELKGELKTLLFAGHETTALAMAWALHHLHRNPAALEALLAELDGLGKDPGPEALAAAPYLGAVCDETLRLHPVVEVVGRRTRAPFTFQGLTLPTGSAIIGAICLTHADPAIYPEPQRFRPERFLERRYSPFEFLPFGGGARRCIGAAFAVYEMRIALGTLLSIRRFSADGAEPERPVRRNVTFGPSRKGALIDEGPR